MRLLVATIHFSPFTGTCHMCHPRDGFFPHSHIHLAIIGNRDRGVKTYRTLDGGDLAPKVVTPRLGLSTPKLAIFCRISVERRQLQGPLEIRDFHPPSNLQRFDPPLSRSPNSRATASLIHSTHANIYIYIFTPFTRIVATKLRLKETLHKTQGICDVLWLPLVFLRASALHKCFVFQKTQYLAAKIASDLSPPNSFSPSSIALN